MHTTNMLTTNRPAQQGPSFICVGPEKTGTSWLYANLEPHPDIFLPPVKEIRYFYEILEYPNETIRARLSKHGDWHSQDHRAYIRERFEHYKKHPSDCIRGRRRLYWDCRFLLGRRNDAWYLSLFNQAGGRRAGDISPQYFSVPENQIEKIARLLPDTKIIVFVRDPIDWSWSFARMSLVGDRNLNEVTGEEFIAFFDQYMKYYTTSSAIGKWMRYFPPDNIYIGFYDMLLDEPIAFYKQICAFLGIDEQRTPERVWRGLSRRINEGRSLPLPDRFATYLAQIWRPEIERLCQKYSPYPQRWLQRWYAISEAIE